MPFMIHRPKSKREEFFYFTYRTPLIIRTVRTARDFPTERVLSRTPLIIRTVDQNLRLAQTALRSGSLAGVESGTKVEIRNVWHSAFGDIAEK